jgi:hypothetical protein
MYNCLKAMCSYVKKRSSSASGHHVVIYVIGYLTSIYYVSHDFLYPALIRRDGLSDQDWALPILQDTAGLLA